MVVDVEVVVVHALHHVRVVVVDDDRDATDTLVWLLQMAGHEVVGCYTGQEAVEKACASSPDVMLIDLAMPGVDGNQMARQVREQGRNKQALLIAISGYADDAHRQLCMSAGFDHYLVKPVEFPVLCALLGSPKSMAAHDLSSA
jgi:CheY-like chemotaxis protein